MHSKRKHLYQLFLPLSFLDCLFENNEATGAETDPCGVVMMQHGQEMKFVECTFKDNKCNGKGGAIWNGIAPDANYPRTLIVEACIFKGNTAAEGADIFLNANSNATITGTTLPNGLNVTGDNIHYEKPTGITNLSTTARNNNATRYNLMGQKVGNNTRGIVIVGAKKYLK